VWLDLLMGVGFDIMVGWNHASGVGGVIQHNSKL
jgi:hypothetical protein